MAIAYLTIAGLYEYDPELFADVDFPGEDVDKDVVIDQIVYDCGELPLVYTKPDFMRKQLRRWSEVNRLTWQRIYLALTEEYNPLHNYDRHEEWEESGEAESQSNTASASSTDHDVAGYNDSEALPTASRDNTGVYQESSGRNSGTNTRDGHTYGNIGVTTSAQMIQGEIETRMMFNYAKIISDMFKTEFCIMVY